MELLWNSLTKFRANEITEKQRIVMAGNQCLSHIAHTSNALKTAHVVKVNNREWIRGMSLVDVLQTANEIDKSRA